MNRPKLLREWRGLRCRTLVEISNGNGALPQGSIVDVRGSWRTGLNIRWVGCEQCGFKWSCSRVNKRELEPIERVGPPDPPRAR